MSTEISFRQRLSKIPFMRMIYDAYLILFKHTYFGGRMATCHSCDFLRDPQFMAAITAAVGRNGTVNATYAWNINVACWAALQASRLDGHFVECGTAKGSTAAAILSYLNWSGDKYFYLFDTFKGLDSNQITEHDTGARNQHYPDVYSDVIEYFGKFKKVVPVRGIVPESLNQIPKSTRVAFLHIDMNCAAPEEAALEFFRDLFVPGAYILLDDYGWLAYGPQKAIHDKFAESLGRKVLPLPTGQGLIIV